MPYHHARALLEQLTPDTQVPGLDAALQALDLERARDDGKSLLAQMSLDGMVTAVALLLARGARPDTRSSLDPWLHGPAVAFAVHGLRPPGTAWIDTVRLLHAHGADLQADVEWVDGADDDRELRGTVLDYGLFLGRRARASMEEHGDDPAARRDRLEAEAMQRMLEALVEMGGRPGLWSMQEVRDFIALRLRTRLEATPAELLQEGIALLAVEDRVAELPDAARRVCFRHLDDEGFMASPEWAVLVRAVIGAALEWSEVVAAVYGEDEAGLAFEEDEGWLAQGWDHYNGFPDLLEVISQPPAIAHPEWGEVLVLLAREHVRFHIRLEEPLRALLERSEVRRRPDHPQIAREVEAAFGR
ncbi:MAG TPA: hypothetical protein VK013_15710 [Myxococcaceae bacterium]|nr:hypothetical protein [Myxococcaceae bacterium]